MGRKGAAMSHRTASLSWGEAAYALVLGGLVAAAYATSPYSLVYNTTESLPPGFYVVDTTRLPLLTEIAVTYPPQSDASGNLYQHPTLRALLSRHSYKLLKPVGAVAGAYLHTRDSYVWSCPDAGPINGRCRLLGVALQSDARGRPLEAWRYNGDRLPYGQVYLGQLDMHPRSLDSRYFGPVPVARLKGVAYPLWTW